VLGVETHARLQRIKEREDLSDQVVQRKWQIVCIQVLIDVFQVEFDEVNVPTWTASNWEFAVDLGELV
jgi:hypothetical protein